MVNYIDSDEEISNLEKMLLAAEEDDKTEKSNESHSKSKDSELKLADGDSSDDEDQRDFQNSKYNDFGRDINKKLKEAEEARKFNSIKVFPSGSASGSFSGSPSTSRNSFSGQTTSGSPFSGDKNSFSGPSSSQNLISKPSTSRGILNNLPSPSGSIRSKTSLPTFDVKSELAKKLAAPPSDPTVFCDPVFGLRIVQPLISSTVLKERMSGKLPVGVQRARFHTERGDLSKDWVIAGVVVSKSPVRQTQKGDQFSIWTISDLKGEIKMVSVFLFRSAHKDLWKTDVGTVIGILNPKVLERKDDKVEAVISVDNSQKVMILGQSKDLGKCKVKKNNGEPCGAIVNKTDCDVCIFHMKKEYSKIKRSEFQSPGLGRGIDNLRNKILGKSEVFYAGQSFTASKPAKKPAKMIQQDRDRLTTLSEYFSVPYNPETTGSSPAGPRTVQSLPVRKAGAAASHDLNISQRKKDLERLKLLQGTETPKIILTAKPEVTTQPEAAQKPEVDPNFVPKLSGGNLTFSFSVPVKNLGKNELAKQRAAQILKKKPLEPSNPNLIKYRGTEAGKRKILEERVNEENEAKKVKLSESEEAKARKEYLMKMMNAKSSHMDLVEDKEADRREKCFDSMEKKEAMEEKMANTTEMKCKAVICRRCKYIYFSASDRCKEERHELKVVDATKRFYQCGDCRNRTVTLFRIPKDECKNCRSRNWKRCGMIKGKDAYVGEQLSIRGDEELFIGGASNVNINLLVPENDK